MKLDDLKNKKILILGFGQEGIDTFKFLRKSFPEKVLAIADRNSSKKEIIKNERKIKFYSGKNYLEALKNYDIIIKSPGIPIHLPKIQKAFRQKRITSATEIFFNNCQGKIIGITGTKGKGTTALMIYQILKKSGFKAHLVGNIGRPALKFLFPELPKEAKGEEETKSLRLPELPKEAKFDEAEASSLPFAGAREGEEEAKLLRLSANPGVYIYEISSHQLYNLKPACRQAGNFPHIAVFLNLFKDHLDYFQNFKEYAKAKANITLYQKKDDFFIYNDRNKIIKQIAKKSRAKKIPISANYKLLANTKIPLLYSQNAMAALAVGKIFKIPDKKIIQAIRNFKSSPHRLEAVGTFKGITFYNDSAATIPEATLAAIQILGNKLETIILGGSEKNVSFKKLAQKILKSRIKTLILFLPTGKKIWRTIVREGEEASLLLLPPERKRRGEMKLQLHRTSLPSEAREVEEDLSSSSPSLPLEAREKEKKKIINHFFVKNMAEAIKLAYKNTSKGKICLLSPASASFGIFKNYKERGDLFKSYVKKLKDLEN